MRKAALQLLAALLQYNPFGGELPEGRFEASLTEWKAKLQACFCILLAGEEFFPTDPLQSSLSCGILFPKRRMCSSRRA